MRLLLIVVLLWLSSGVVFAQETDDCPVTRLQVGDYGYVITQDPINVRATPNGERLGQLYQWQAFRVIDGSQCEAGFRWWQVEADRLSGWVAEGVGEDYWLEPVMLTDDSVIDTATFNLLTQTQRYEAESNLSASFTADSSWYVLGEGFPDYKVYAFHRFYEDRIVLIEPELAENTNIASTTVSNNTVAIALHNPNRIEYWDLNTKERYGVIEDYFVYDMSFVDNMLVYIGLQTIYGYQYLEEILTIDTSPKTGTQLAVEPNETRFAVIYLDRTMDLFNVNGDTIEVFEESGSGIFDVTFSVDNQQMIYAYCREPIEAAGQECIHHKIVFWDIESRDMIKTLDFINPSGGSSHIELALNPIGDLLLIHSGSKLWGYSTETGEVIGQISDFIGEGIQFSGDGKTLIQRGSRSEIQIWGIPQK